MKKEDCFRLGVIIKPFSFKGEVVARFEVSDPMAYGELDRIFLEDSGSLVPYFITRSSHKSRDQFRFGLEDVSTEADARSLVGSSIFLPLEELVHEEALGPELVGFSVVDEKLGALGTVINYMDLPNNPQLEVSDDSREFLVPLQDAFIRAIDTHTKVISTDLPEGLIDL